MAAVALAQVMLMAAIVMALGVVMRLIRTLTVGLRAARDNGRSSRWS